MVNVNVEGFKKPRGSALTSQENTGASAIDRAPTVADPSSRERVDMGHCVSSAVTDEATGLWAQSRF